MPDHDTIEADVIDIVQNKCSRSDLVVSRDSKLLDLGVDSLDVVDIIFEIEERWKVELPFNANSAGAFEMNTVGEVIDRVSELLPDG
ncbi:MAG TPA: acyl carrier protein [Allosphingosinicella sp.]|jgi:acyl carrier protein